MNFCLKILKSIGLVYTVFAMLTAVTVFGGIEQVKEETFDVKPGGRLMLDSDIGSIEIVGRGNDKLNVQVVMEADTRDEDRAEEIFADLVLEMKQDGNDVNIYADYDNYDRNFWGNRKSRLRVKFLIAVPEEYNIDVETGGGTISIENLNGDINCQTSGGGLEFEGIQGEIRGQTSGGGIDIVRCRANIDVETSGGGIRIDEAEGRIFASTSGGGIDIDDVKGSIEASTSGGGITAYISGQPTDNCSLTTSGGGIKVYLDENVNIDLDARTSSGRVKSDFFDTRNRNDDSKKRFSSRVNSSWRGEINDGGPELYLRTSAGNIYIEKM